MLSDRLNSAPRIVALALAFLILGLLAPTLTATPADDENTASGTKNGEKEEDDRYVVHDEVFVDEEAPEIPGSSTIAAKLPLALAETPISVDEITAERIEQRGSFVLGDALKSAAGINVQSGNGIFDVFTIRGLDSSANGLILTDGAPEPQTAFYQLYNVERVEVLRGPASFLYGGFSMGGAVNLVRKQPTDGNFVRLGLRGGSFQTFQGTVDANYLSEDGSWGARVNAQWLESDLYRDNVPMENFAVNPAFLFRVSERTTVHVNLEAIDTDAVPDAGIPLFFDGQGFSVPNVRRRESYNAPFSTSEQEVGRLQIDVETRFSENFRLRNKTFFRRLDWLSNSTILNGILPNPADGSLAVSRSQLVLDDEQTFVGNQIEALWRIKSGRVSHNLIFGLELAELADEFTFDVGFLPDIALFNPVETATEPLFIIPGQSFGADTTATVIAPYVVDQIRFSDKFQLTLGLRFDDIDFEDKVFGIKRDDSEASPMAGFVYSPSERVSIYANAGSAFSPPSTFAAGAGNREPEESEQLELGLRTSSADGRLNASVAVYQLDRTNVAIPDQTGLPRQTGEQRSEGVELELSAELLPGLDLRFAYTYTDAELVEFTEQIFVFDPATFQVVPVTVDRSGNAVPWAPENIVQLWLSKGFDGGFGIAGGGRYIDEQWIAADNAFAVDDHVLVDAVLWYGQNDWRLQLNLDNLTDEETFTRVFNSSSVVPAAGFEASLGLRFGF